MPQLKIKPEYDPASFDDLTFSRDLEEVLEFDDNGVATIEVDLTKDFFLMAVFVATAAKKPLKLHLTPSKGFRVRYRRRPKDMRTTIPWVTERTDERDTRQRLTYLEPEPPSKAQNQDSQE